MISNGIDIIKVNRFDSLKNNVKFMSSIFTENELDYIKKADYNSKTIAGIYSAKESFLKAIKKGINNYDMKDIEIIHDNNNAPFIILHNELKDKYKNISVSISHEEDYAISVTNIID